MVGIAYTFDLTFQYFLVQIQLYKTEHIKPTEIEHHEQTKQLVWQSLYVCQLNQGASKTLIERNKNN